MKIENVNVYDLEESVIASGYPMSTEVDGMEEHTTNFKYWLENGIDKIFNILKEDDRFYLNDDKLFMRVTSVITEISPEDLVVVSKNKWTYSGEYVYSLLNQEPLHRVLLCGDYECIDHIDRNKLNNTIENLRGATKQENAYNSKLSSNNTSGVTGVSFSKCKSKWRSYINVDHKQIFLGYFTDINDAIKVRLKAEIKYFGEFSPQTHLFKKFNLCVKNDVVDIMSISQALNHYKRIGNLGGTPTGSGHDQALSGIRVSFDLTCSIKMWVEMERYKFVDFVSSQSTMHRITRFNIKDQCNDYVWIGTMMNMTEMVDIYNDIDDKSTDDAKDLYLQILYNAPTGFELTARLSTNYRSLKTIYHQRRNHKLPEWREFCKWVENLPHFKELVLG